MKVTLLSVLSVTKWAMELWSSLLNSQHDTPARGQTTCLWLSWRQIRHTTLLLHSANGCELDLQYPHQTGLLFVLFSNALITTSFHLFISSNLIILIAIALSVTSMLMMVWLWSLIFLTYHSSSSSSITVSKLLLVSSSWAIVSRSVSKSPSKSSHSFGSFAVEPGAALFICLACSGDKFLVAMMSFLY